MRRESYLEAKFKKKNPILDQSSDSDKELYNIT